MYFICFYLLSFTAIVQNIYIDKMLQTNSKEQVLSAMATPTLKQTENEKKLDEWEQKWEWMRIEMIAQKQTRMDTRVHENTCK